MLWRIRQPDRAGGRAGAVPEPELPLTQARFDHHLAALTSSAEACGGIDACLAALNDKHACFAAALAPEALERIDPAATGRLLDRVFTARRRLGPMLAALGTESLREVFAALVAGSEAAHVRIQGFVDRFPGATGTDREALRTAARQRRAAWDFAAELLHFRDPRGCPLMTRWVWDAGTQTGALRELAHGHDAVASLDLGTSSDDFVRARDWVESRVRALGVFRDLPLWCDLVLAQAYVGYLRAMTEGHLGADFGRGTRPDQQLRCLLGIDDERRAARARRQAA